MAFSLRVVAVVLSVLAVVVTTTNGVDIDTMPMKELSDRIMVYLEKHQDNSIIDDPEFKVKLTGCASTSAAEEIECLLHAYISELFARGKMVQNVKNNTSYQWGLPTHI